MLFFVAIMFALYAPLSTNLENVQVICSFHKEECVLYNRPET